MDSKIKRYYSKALLKEAIESVDVKYLDMVRYKTMTSIDVGIGGVNGYNYSFYHIRYQLISLFCLQIV